MGAIAGIKNYKKIDTSEQKIITEKMIESMKNRAPFFHIHTATAGDSIAVRYHKEKNEVSAYDKEKDILVLIDGKIFDLGKHENEFGSIDNDAEIILELYRLKGDSFVDHIDGSYIIVIWDGPKNKLIFIRDRVGSKPFFFFKDNKKVIFASQIKGILASGEDLKSVDLVSLNNFLSYWYVPNPNSILKDVKQVKPGHMIIFRDGEVLDKEYWKFKYNIDQTAKSEEYYIEKFLEIFKKAVSKRLKKFPDCGAFLSGGLDTSSVVAMMSIISKQPFKVFTGGFEDEEFNEFGDAKVVADYYNLDHYTALVDLSNDFPGFLNKIIWHHDSPFVDTSAIPSYVAAKYAKDHVDTVLTGDFPDQLIGGSGHQVQALEMEKSGKLLFKLLRNKFINSIVSSLPLSSSSTSFFDKAKRAIYRESFSIEEQRILTIMPIPELLKRSVYSDAMLEVYSNNDPMNYARELYDEVKDCSLLDKILYFDTLSYAVDDLMVKVERMTMAHGLQAYTPFHDLELVEFVASLPTQMKIKDLERKYVMKEALRPYLPEHTLTKKKKGFDMPLEELLIKKYPDYVKEILLDPLTLNRGYFNKKNIEKLVKDFLKEKTDYASGSSATIISLLTLELWHRLFIDN